MITGRRNREKGGCLSKNKKIISSRKGKHAKILAPKESNLHLGILDGSPSKVYVHITAVSYSGLMQ